MEAATLKKPKGSALQRINSALTASEKIGIPRDAAMFTTICIEIQVLENRIAELEKKLSKYVRLK